jgi:uncharacterized repeat protein (TIGR02543 family)
MCSFTSKNASVLTLLSSVETGCNPRVGRLSVWSIGALAALSMPIYAAEIRWSAEGTVNNATTGFAASVGDPVTVKFSYDSAATAVVRSQFSFGASSYALTEFCNAISLSVEVTIGQSVWSGKVPTSAPSGTLALLTDAWSGSGSPDKFTVLASSSDAGVFAPFPYTGSSQDRSIQIVLTDATAPTGFLTPMVLPKADTLVSEITAASGFISAGEDRIDFTLLPASIGVVGDAPTVTVLASNHGVITDIITSFPTYSVATLTASANPGYQFFGWTGDATGTDNPLSVVMVTNKIIGATFTPDTRDTDGDGLTNYQEIVEYGTSATKQDTDDDGVNDRIDAFPLDQTETIDNDNDNTGDNADADDDNDGCSDEDETNIHHTNPKLADSDGDGLTDLAEIESHHTNPNLADSDNDGLRDGEEITTYQTKPLLGDTDSDGFLDGYEVLTGKSPLNALDKPALVAEARIAIEFTFPAALGTIYRIEASTDLAVWEIIESGIVGTGGEIQRFYSTRGQPKRYYRVEEVAAP